MAKSTGAFACQSDATLVTGRQDGDVTGVSDQWVDGEAMSDHNHKCQPSLFKCTQSREIIRKATSIVATCSVSPPKVYQTPWRLWTTRREAACNRRSLTFNNGAGHIIVRLHNGRSSLPLKTSQGSIPAPGNGTAPARGGAAATSQPLGRLTKSVYLL